MIKTVGVIGQGFVGNSVKEGFKDHFDVKTYDLDPNKRTSRSIEDLVETSDVVFCCIPTPMDNDGKCNVSILESVVGQISKALPFPENDSNYKFKPVLIKSTIPPGTTSGFTGKYLNLNLIFNPEFLTEANAVNDYKNQTRIVLGIGQRECPEVIAMFNKVFPDATVIKTKSGVAEMVKYTTNCFLATKVSFANELWRLCNELDIDYDKVIEYAKYDKRLGNSHWNVPGPDGDFGYGGHCFPKDIAALKYVANNLGLDTYVLDGTIRVNDEVRMHRDWESQFGRAVSDDFVGKVFDPTSGPSSHKGVSDK